MIGARQSNPKAQTLLGAMYATGHCVGRDLPIAYRWFAKALHGDPGNSRVQRDLEVLWKQMTPEERLVADFRGTGMTVGPHPMKYHRASMKRQGILTASELERLPDGTHVRVAGGVIARQRPGTAKGFVFLSIEDETGIANAIVTPRVFEEHHVTIVHQQFLLVEGQLQHQDNVVSVKVESVQALSVTRAETTSHDFH